MCQRPAVGTGITSMGCATDLLYSNRAGRFGGHCQFSVHHRGTHYTLGRFHPTCVHALEASGSLWELGRPCKWRSIQKSLPQFTPQPLSPSHHQGWGYWAPRSPVLECHCPISCAMSLQAHRESLCWWLETGLSPASMHRAREPQLGDCSLGLPSCVPWQL